MKTIITIIILLFPFTASAKSYGDFEGAKYVRNYDGDTITFNLPGYPPIIGKKLGVRVNGIDTPEIKGECEKEKVLARIGKKLVANLFKGAQEINLKNMKRGKYFRIVADVIVDGRSVAAALIKNKLAVPYDGGTKTKDWCK